MYTSRAACVCACLKERTAFTAASVRRLSPKSFLVFFGFFGTYAAAALETVAKPIAVSRVCLMVSMAPPTGFANVASGLTPTSASQMWHSFWKCFRSLV